MTVPVRPAPSRVQLPAPGSTFSRADIVFMGLEHDGPSVEVRIFFNARSADENTPMTPEAGFAGFFTIFGHHGCWGDDGHCDIPRDRRQGDLRRAHPLTPITKHVEATDAVRRLLDAGTRDLTITIVPVVDEVPEYVPEHLANEPVRFQRLSIVFYE